MGNPWIEHVKKYQKKHPNLDWGQCLKQAKKSYKKRKHGGNPLLVAGVTEAVKAIPGTVNAIGDQIDKGRKTQHEFNKDNGALMAERSKNFQQFYRDLMHKRFWDGESLPPSLRWPREKTNNPKYADQQEKKDQALYDWAEKQWDKNKSY